MSITVNGASGISATIIADSISEFNDTRIITYELVYQRYIHSEVLTHREFSRNAASSRAIPVKAMIEQVQAKSAVPISWGKNQAGMQAGEDVFPEIAEEALKIWKEHKESTIKAVQKLSNLGIHKQIANRLLEPHYMYKSIVTSTEWDNWDMLRFHPDAQPEIQELARVMIEARKISVPRKVGFDGWHMPYVEVVDGFYYSEGKKITLDEALMISSSCCAQVSYRKNDPSLEKANIVYERLVGAVPFHASPFEHQATPTANAADQSDVRSGNFRNWKQYRKILGK